MDVIGIQCACGWQRDVPSEHVGKRVVCKMCGKGVDVVLPVASEPALVPIPAKRALRSSRIGSGIGPGRRSSGSTRAARPRKSSSSGLLVLGLVLVGLIVLVAVVAGRRAPDAPAERHGAR